MKTVRTAVIGATWSGWAAALHAARKSSVTLFAADQQLFSDGLVFAADSRLQRLCAEIGVELPDGEVFGWQTADGFSFRLADWPAPFNRLLGVRRAKGLSRSEQKTLLRQWTKLGKIRVPQGGLAAWLRAEYCPPKLLRGFWQPFAALLHTPLEKVSLAAAQNLLRETVMSSREHSRVHYLPSDFGKTFAGVAQTYLENSGGIFRNETVNGRLACLPNGQVAVNGEAFDRVIVALPSEKAAALLPEHTPETLMSSLLAMPYQAKGRIRLRYPQALRLPQNGLLFTLCGNAGKALFSDGLAVFRMWEDTPHNGRFTARVQVWLAPREAAENTEAEAAFLQQLDEAVRSLNPALPRCMPDYTETEWQPVLAAETGRCVPDCAVLEQQHIYLAGAYLRAAAADRIEDGLAAGTAAAELAAADMMKKETICPEN
ncbi:MAG: FAD-dependent oxidoreductase [Neisseria sp.]|nr:FAD-dependent oxidoreductase [Neisseria sp.]